MHITSSTRDTAMKTRHSPAPWIADHEEAIRIRDASGTLAMLTHLTRSGRRDPDEVAANARLIVAAPELREQLLHTLASLTGALSLLERGGKRAAPSDRMFEQMLDDCRRAAGAARAVLLKTEDA
jgi:hypothetical protein